MELSNNTKKFWKQLKIGDVIGLQDKQAIEDQMEEGKELGETDYEVRSIKTFKADGDHGCLAEYLLVELVQSEETIFLSVKIVDVEVCLRVYYEVQEFDQGNRADMLENDCEWIFEEPEDTENFNLSDLVYAQSITQKVDEEDIEFTLLPQGELSGGLTNIPKESGIGDVFMTLAEYSTDVDCGNPYILITEEEFIKTDEDDDDNNNLDDGNLYNDDGYSEDFFDGGMIQDNDISDDVDDDDYEDDEDDDTGGVITLYLGADLSPLDLNIYPKEK